MHHSFNSFLSTNARTYFLIVKEKANLGGLYLTYFCGALLDLLLWGLSKRKGKMYSSVVLKIR